MAWACWGHYVPYRGDGRNHPVIQNLLHCYFSTTLMCTCGKQSNLKSCTKKAMKKELNEKL